jgi:hypothetical protein
MSSKFQFGVLLVFVILVLGGGMVIADAQPSDTALIYLPLVITGGTPPVTPTPSKTSAITPTPISTATIAPTPTDVTQPIVVYLHPVEDANIGDGGPDKNDGNPTEIWVGTYGEVERGLIKFDLSSIPTGSHIMAANLDLDYEMRAGASSPVPTFTITLYRNTTPWDESTVTWNSQPLTAEGYGTQSFNTFGSKSFDVMNLVAAWVNGTNPNYGIMVGGGAN